MVAYLLTNMFSFCWSAITQGISGCGRFESRSQTEVPTGTGMVWRWRCFQTSSARNNLTITESPDEVSNLAIVSHVTAQI